MKIASNGRVRRSEAEWRELFLRFEKSGLNAREFCGKEGIGHESFRRWRIKLNAEVGQSAFVPVTSEPSSPPPVVDVGPGGGTSVVDRLRSRGWLGFWEGHVFALPNPPIIRLAHNRTGGLDFRVARAG